MHRFKTLIPQRIKTNIKVFLVFFRDIFHSGKSVFVKYSTSRITQGKGFEERISIVQPINQSQWAEPKIHNIDLAVSRFQDLAIHPGEIFSFWRLVGKTTEKKGYRKGINIIRGKLSFDTGGGLCQLSGLLYHLIIKAGIEVVERYPHSVDLYTDETRYTPLGSDATVAFGYKDLRIKNNFDIPVCFRIRVKGFKLIGYLCAPEPIEEYTLEFHREDVEDGKKVRTMRILADGETEKVNESIYRNASHDQAI